MHYLPLIHLAGEANRLSSLLPLAMPILIIVLMYFLMIRPQQKKRKEEDKKRSEQGVAGQVLPIEEDTIPKE